MATMRYDDFIAKIDFDDEEKLFHGLVVNTADAIDFYGSSVKELQREFKKSIDVYHQVCKEKGIEPSKPFSGRFNLRLTPEQHRLISAAAAAAGMSLNQWVAETLEEEARGELEE